MYEYMEFIKENKQTWNLSEKEFIKKIIMGFVSTACKLIEVEIVNLNLNLS